MIFRKCVTVLLAILLLFQMTQGLLLFSYWKLNTVELTEKYCINKNNPEKNCNASCYLTKQLEKQEGGDCCNKSNSKKEPVKSKKGEEFQCFYLIPTTLHFNAINLTVIKAFFHYHISKSVVERPTIFQPPRV